MFGITIIKTKQYPFYKEIKRLIAAHSEYQEGIEKGVVHLAFDPGQREAMKAKKEATDEATP